MSRALIAASCVVLMPSIMPAAAAAAADAAEVITVPVAPYVTLHSQRLVSGWDVTEPNLGGVVNWSVREQGSLLNVTYNLTGADPSHVYQVGVLVQGHCDSPEFGTYPGSACRSIARGPSPSINASAVEVGALATDTNGNGTVSASFQLTANDTYKVQFYVRNGAGCDLSPVADNCDVIAQSPASGNDLTVITTGGG